MSLKKKFRQLCEKTPLTKKMYHKAHARRVQRRMSLDDEAFAQDLYWQKRRKRLDLENPKTFDEKLWWLKLYYRNPLMPVCADKYRIREYLKECGEEQLANELYGVYERAEDIDYDSLPEEFFLKTNHGCGSNFHCHKKDTFPKEKVARELNKALSGNYYYQSREWSYKDIPPRIVAEKVHKPSDGQLIDYRMMCFNGVCRLFGVLINACDETGEHSDGESRQNLYDRDLNLLDLSITRDTFRPETKLPDNIREMIALAEKLAKPFPFVRVDLYSYDNQIKIGEMTFYHWGGSNVINPPEWEMILGDYLTLPGKDDPYVIKK